MGVIIHGDLKVVHIKRYFALNVFVLTRFHCMILITKDLKLYNHFKQRSNNNNKRLCIIISNKNC